MGKTIKMKRENFTIMTDFISFRAIQKHLEKSKVTKITYHSDPVIGQFKNIIIVH